MYRKKREVAIGLQEAALLGYEHELEKIHAKIADLHRRLGIKTPPINTSKKPAPRAPRKKHRISPEGRARIAAAQRRRWAAAKKRAAK